MKRLIKPLLYLTLYFTVMVGVHAHAQSIPMKNSVYATEWQQLKNLENQGLNKQAYELADKIYGQAKRDQQNYEQIKALLIKERYRREVTDATQNSQETVTALQQLLTQTQGVSKSIVHSLIAQLLWQYYSTHQHLFAQRTQVVDQNKSSKDSFLQSDIETWDLKSLQNETAKHYRASLSNADLLQKTPIDQAELLLTHIDDGNDNSNKNNELRPTLYDLLAHRALSYFTNTQSGLSSPKATFSLNQTHYYDPAAKFVKATLPSTDALGYDALAIYQNLIKFHLQSAPNDALVDIDLERLNFINQYQTIENKKDLYVSSLQEMITTYDKVNLNSLVYAALAKAYDQDYPYNAKITPQNQWYRKKAFDLCQKAIAKYPSNEGTSLCQRHINQLTTPEASIEIPSIVAPNVQFPFLLKHRNIVKAYLKVVAIDDKTAAHIQYRGWSEHDQRMKALLKKDAIHEFNQEVKNSHDFQQNSIELPFPALPVGYYLVLFSGDEDFTQVNRYSGWALIQASQLSFLRRDNNPNQSIDLSVLDRNSGLPLPDTQVYVYDISQNGEQMDLEENLSKSNIYHTDAQGYIPLDQTQLGLVQGKRVWLVRNKDRLLVGDVYLYHHNQDRYTRQVSHFFTDRAIYRPGQTLYFKGLLLNRTDKSMKNSQFRILPHQETEVGFYNTNGELILKKSFKSDAFGTFAGEFQIPKGLLNGQMRIGNEHGNVYVQVEEYKRPKFEVVFEPQVGDFKLGDLIKIKGLAKSYAGATISGGEVKYRITRQSRYSPTSYWLRWWQPQPPIEIAHGQVKTLANGEFFIEFKATPDLQVDAKTKPEFNFEIFADVTDAAGETQSAQTALTVGYEALQLSSDLPKDLILGQYKATTLEATTLDGVAINATGQVTVTKLEPPKRWVRNRLWEPPTELMNKKSFIEHLPTDPYGDETDFATWQTANEGQSRRFDTKNTKQIDLSDLLSKTGVYAVKWQTQDKFGQAIELIQYTVVVDSKSKQLPYPVLDWFVPITSTVEPGETASFLVGTTIV